MRDNPVKHRLAAGGRAFGAMTFEFFSPGMPQIICAAGAEFVLFDMEHSGIGIETIKAQIAACRGLDIVPGVRVPATEYHFIANCLDAGAMSIMVPMVESVEQARDIVNFAHYPPVGRRGAGFGMAHDDYGPASVTDKIAMARRRTQVIVQIETARGAAAVDAIAAVEGVDVLWLGHFDLTNFMGIPAQFKHPDYLRAVKEIVAAAERHGKVAGFMATDETWARDYLGHGFRMMAYGLDSGLYQAALARGLAAMREAVPEEKSHGRKHKTA
ncbi:MAG TPA: aldolase/citrate lyase family protein [Acetobacteraceae bacterium]|nr:aldolase/citrate lyase family protein [Acetobacteraceae bacterium]